jgi:serine carboxypeptidase-like clade 2
VILWFNGGPGCSSLLGFFQEHGPYVMDNGQYDFIANPYSWNKEATVLYIESPAGVGFSLCPD